VYESLGGYPLDTVRQMVESGLKSDNSEIKAICARLLKGQKGGGN
jgi:hypothetical protein